MENLTTEYASNLCRTIEKSKDLNPIYLMDEEKPLVSFDTNLGHFDPRMFIRKEWLTKEAYDASRFKCDIDQLMVNHKLEVFIVKNYIDNIDLSRKGRSIKYNKNIIGVNIDSNYIDCESSVKCDLSNRLLFDNTCYLNPMFLNALGMKKRRNCMPKGIQLIIEKNYDISQLLCLTYTSNEYLNNSGLLIKYKTILQDVACDMLYLKHFTNKANALQSAEIILDEAENLGLNRDDLKKYFASEYSKFIEWSWEDFD